MLTIRIPRETQSVTVPPQAPSISASSAAPAREGQEYQLNCQSLGGNPEPNITWFKNDLQLIAGQGLRMEQVRQNGTTSSVLTWIPTMDDHQAIYKCEVSNKAMNGLAPFEREVTLLVECKYSSSLSPFLSEICAIWHGARARAISHQTNSAPVGMVAALVREETACGSLPVPRAVPCRLPAPSPA